MFRVVELTKPPHIHIHTHLKTATEQNDPICCFKKSLSLSPSLVGSPPFTPKLAPCQRKINVTAGGLNRNGVNLES